MQIVLIGQGEEEAVIPAPMLDEGLDVLAEMRGGTPAIACDLVRMAKLSLGSPMMARAWAPAAVAVGPHTAKTPPNECGPRRNRRESLAPKRARPPKPLSGDQFRQIGWFFSSLPNRKAGTLVSRIHVYRAQAWQSPRISSDRAYVPNDRPAQAIYVFEIHNNVDTFWPVSIVLSCIREN